MRQDISFLSENFKLEGIIYTPDAISEGPFPAAIVLHPHPQFGGSMYNNVVDAVCETLENSMIALKFNCRGVGRSEGHSSTTGKQEGIDVLAAINYLKTNEAVDQDKIVVIGYSWGTKIGFPVTHANPDVSLLIGISCPIGLWNYGYLRECSKPKLLIVGTFDQFAPLEKIQHLFDQLLDPKELFVLETDHFYMGQEGRMADKVSEFLKKAL